MNPLHRIVVLSFLTPHISPHYHHAMPHRVCLSLALVALVLAAASLAASPPTSATLIQTSLPTGDRLSNKGSVAFGPDFQSTNSIDINSSIMYQKMLGFGGAFTEAASLNFLGLQPSLQAQIIAAYWGTDGLGYVIGRVHMNRYRSLTLGWRQASQSIDRSISQLLVHQHVPVDQMDLLTVSI
jgi:hypothetical protein